MEAEGFVVNLTKINEFVLNFFFGKDFSKKFKEKGSQYNKRKTKLKFFYYPKNKKKFKIEDVFKENELKEYEEYGIFITAIL